MATQLQNKFSEWNFTVEELSQVPMFTDLQKKFLQNELAIVAHEKVAIKYDPESPLTFVQQEAELQGKINILEYLLSLNPAATKSFDGE